MCYPTTAEAQKNANEKIDKVKEIISASSKEEATSLLFGPKTGVYSQEMFNAIVAKFTKKKESSIWKEYILSDGRAVEKIVFDKNNVCLTPIGIRGTRKNIFPEKKKK